MIGFEMTKYFFSAKAVKKAVDRTTRRVFAKFGAFVRQTAKQSIRKRNKPSQPGSPPSSHTGLLNKFIWFGYDPAKRSVVIGPAQLSQNNRGEAPSLLEYGGMGMVKRKGKRTKARIRARPFMGPAFAKEQKQLPALWANSIK
jgi:hypothetical protein